MAYANRDGRQPKRKASPGVTPEQRRRIQEQMLAKLQRRTALEQEILSLIGGRTGMICTWEEMLIAAAAGDEAGFRFYGTSYQSKAEQLRRKLEKLNRMIRDSRNQKIDRKYGIRVGKMLSQPFSQSEMCTELLAKADALRDSGLTEQEDLTEEVLKKWIREVRHLADPAEGDERDEI